MTDFSTLETSRIAKFTGAFKELSSDARPVVPEPADFEYGKGSQRVQSALAFCCVVKSLSDSENKLGHRLAVYSKSAHFLLYAVRAHCFAVWAPVAFMSLHSQCLRTCTYLNEWWTLYRQRSTGKEVTKGARLRTLALLARFSTRSAADWLDRARGSRGSSSRRGH